MSFIKKCAICGTEFKAYNSRSKYCSAECKKIARENYLKEWHEEHSNYMKEWRKKHPDYDNEWHAKHKNYDRDRWRKIRGTKQYERDCVICGKHFTTFFPKEVTCSKECSLQYRRRFRNRRFRAMKETGNYDFSISLEKLILRDNGICHLCGEKIDLQDYYIKNNSKCAGLRYPSIDHIKPISKGGEHTWENVKLAHMQCNAKKGAKEYAYIKGCKLSQR